MSDSNVNVRSRPRRPGQSLAEILIAVIFLATGGLVVYSSTIKSVSDAGWEADRVFAQGLLRDLVETYSAVEWCEFDPANAKLPGVVYDIPLNDPNEDQRALQECSSPSFQSAIIEDTPFPGPDDPAATGQNLTPLQWRSFLRTDVKFEDEKSTDTKDQLEKDPAHKVYQEYLGTINRIGAKRCVAFRQDPANPGSAVVTCFIFYKAANGVAVTLKAHTMRFQKVKCNPSDPFDG
jgi:hypothetical protein